MKIVKITSDLRDVEKLQIGKIVDWTSADSSKLHILAPKGFHAEIRNT